MPELKSTLNFLTSNLRQTPQFYVSYGRYYQAQALFQGDVEAWEKWNQQLIRELKSSQAENGSIGGQFGAECETALNLLALALNFRFLPIYER